MTGIEPVTPTWKDGMLPLHHIRKMGEKSPSTFPSHGRKIIKQTYKVCQASQRIWTDDRSLTRRVLYHWARKAYGRWKELYLCSPSLLLPVVTRRGIWHLQNGDECPSPTEDTFCDFHCIRGQWRYDRIGHFQPYQLPQFDSNKQPQS